MVPIVLSNVNSLLLISGFALEKNENVQVATPTLVHVQDCTFPNAKEKTHSTNTTN